MVPASLQPLRSPVLLVFCCFPAYILNIRVAHEWSEEERSRGWREGGRRSCISFKRESPGLAQTLPRVEIRKSWMDMNRWLEDALLRAGTLSMGPGDMLPAVRHGLAGHEPRAQQLVHLSHCNLHDEDGALNSSVPQFPHLQHKDYKMSS